MMGSEIKRAPRSEEKKYEGVVAFDLDGTLLRGIRHSWSLLWKAVGCSREEAIKCQKAFVAGEIDYKQWVRHDFESLRDNGLTLDKINDAIKATGCSLTKNMKPAIKMLKDNGYVTAVISGGVDAVLKHFIPDPEKYFDELFINRLVWDDQNNLIDIIATDYDWDPGKKGVLGKCGGLKEICRKYKVSLEKSVFVGNDENDFMAMRVAGRKVYFSAQGIETAKTVEGVKIEQKNDLLAVAEYIIGKN